MHTVTRPTASPRWAMYWLWAAGIYNLVWGTVTILAPNLLFDVTGIPRVNYPEIWQCVGMIVGVYGIGYLLASGDSRTHWPIVLVGLLGKIFGPIGFAVALAKGTFPPLFGLTILTNDLLWWIPFSLILWDALLHHRREFSPSAGSVVKFVRESRIAASPDEVFRFHESSQALTALIPPWENMTVATSSGSIRTGSEVVLRGRIFLLPLTWVARHTEYDPPRLFADLQVAGPFEYWNHRHLFLDDGAGGTILRDEVEYIPPLGFIGRLLGGTPIRKKLERMFDYRHKTTRDLVESGRWKTLDTTVASNSIS
jgi:ligand-binding SRPBCC domain-containing protein